MSVHQTFIKPFSASLKGHFNVKDQFIWPFKMTAFYDCLDTQHHKNLKILL
jgi:hypothetical protein